MAGPSFLQLLNNSEEVSYNLNLEITARLIKNLEELANNKELSDAHEKADRILLEFAPDEIKNGWQKVTKVRIE